MYLSVDLLDLSMSTHCNALQHTTRHCNTQFICGSIGSIHVSLYLSISYWTIASLYSTVASIYLSIYLSIDLLDLFVYLLILCVQLCTCNMRRYDAWGGTATHCNALQRTATHYTTVQPTATHCNTLQHTATHCNALQHTATHCNTLHHTASHCDTQQHTSTHCNALQHTTRHCNTLQYTAAHCSALQHTATHCNLLCMCMYITCQVRTMWIASDVRTALRHSKLQQCSPLQHTATHCNTVQRTATHLPQMYAQHYGTVSCNLS